MYMTWSGGGDPSPKNNFSTLGNYSYIYIITNKPTIMRKLGIRNYTLISRGVKTHGTYNPNEILYLFEEQLYCHQVQEIISFLKWVHENDKGFGSGNYEDIFKEWRTYLKANFKPAKNGLVKI
jgi:hypothetical protein